MEVGLKNIALMMLFIYNHQSENKGYGEIMNFSTKEIEGRGRTELISKAESDEGYKKVTGQIIEKGYAKKDTTAVNIRFEGGEKPVLMTFFVRGAEKMIMYYFESKEIILGYIRGGSE